MKNKQHIEGTPQFVPVQTWYTLMLDLEHGFLDYMEKQNIMAMIIMYRYMYSKLKPYITQHMTDKHSEKLNINDVYKLRQNLKSGEADYISKHNEQIFQQINEIIMDKIDILNQLVAKSELYLPLKKTDRKPAVLAQDDW